MPQKTEDFFNSEFNQPQSNDAEPETSPEPQTEKDPASGGKQKQQQGQEKNGGKDTRQEKGPNSNGFEEFGKRMESLFEEQAKQHEKLIREMGEKSQKQIEELYKIAEQVLNNLNGNNSEQEKKEAEAVQDEAEEAIQDEVSSDKIWDLKPTDLDPERLKLIFGGGLKDSVLSKLSHGRAHRSRLEKAGAEFKQIHSERYAQAKIQRKKEEDIRKQEPEKARLEAKVAHSKAQLEAERGAKISPLENRYRTVQAQLERANEMKYSAFRNPIAKAKNAWQKSGLKTEVKNALTDLENAQVKFSNKEAKHQKIVAEHSALMFTITNLQKEIEDSNKTCDLLENQIRALFGIAPKVEKKKTTSERKKPKAKEHEEEDNDNGDTEENESEPKTKIDEEKKPEDKFDRAAFLDELLDLKHNRAIKKNVATFQAKIKEINDKYGAAFKEQEGEFLDSFAVKLEDGNSVYLKAFHSDNKQFHIEMKINDDKNKGGNKKKKK